MTASPTSASAIACRISGVGLVTVSLLRSIIVRSTDFGPFPSSKHRTKSILQSRVNNFIVPAYDGDRTRTPLGLIKINLGMRLDSWSRVAANQP